MKMLNAEEFCIQKSSDNKLSLVYKTGKAYADVFFVPLFPHSMPRQYISIRFPTENNGEEEIGILHNLETLSSFEQKLAFETIEQRNPLAVITEILSIKMRGDTDHWHVETNKGQIHFIGERRYETIVLMKSGLVLVTDNQLNRYKIPNYYTLPQKQRILLEKVLS